MIELYNCDCGELLRGGQLRNRKIIIVTDPPFNIGYKYRTYKDRKKEQEYWAWIAGLLTELNSPYVVIHYPEALYRLAIEVGQAPNKVCSWTYNSNNKRQHRDVAYFGVTPDFKKVTQPYKNPTDKRVKALIAAGKTGAALYDWWNINQVKNTSAEKTAHPCQMPLEVMKNIIGILPEDYTILDIFMGSGTTGVACQELGRDFIGCELDTEYYEIAKERINKTLGEYGSV